jgi:exodeoxyribonuclease V beta subunit
VTTSHTDAQPFDVRGPLPTGVTVLEASAGTGKTYTIAALAARYVADGVPLQRLLLVTFTRMATGELRERVRERLVSVEYELGRVIAGVRPSADEVVALLAEGTNKQVRQRRDNLAQALADFDAATIATTHGFCQEVLASLGIAGDIDPDTTFVEDTRDLVEEIVDDLYVRRFHTDDKPPPFTRAQASEIARVAVENPAAPIVSAKGDTPQMRRRLAKAVRDEFEERKRRMAIMGYDDLLTRLKKTLDAQEGDAVAERLRTRWSVVLVDEFQDTDPVQWDIVRRAFGGGDSTLVLIGDPKQAIYAFRGADVYAYLDAARSAGARATLAINWRSDQGLIDAYDTTFGGAKLGNEGIVYRKVEAAAANQAPRLTGAPHAAPLRIRHVRRDDPGIALTPRGFANVNSAREHVATDVAQDLVELLASNARVECRTEDGRTREHQDVSPGHVAVLVPTNRLAARIRDALDAAGIPAVINGAGSVFGTPAAREWLRLLEAIERPASPTRARAAALTCFLGWTTEQVAAAGEDGGEEIHRRLHDWARTLRVKGVASLTQTIMLSERLPRRVLARADGERRLTDLRHIAQLLHGAAAAEQMGTTALTAWLRRRIAEADQDTGDEERSRRLESDAEAVQVLTIHRSKGLEFPIVYLPFLWEPGRIPNGKQPVLFHDADAGDERTIDLALQGDDFRRHHEQAVVEQRGEDLRLAYVALTRAQHQAVVWWAGSWDSRHSPLGRLLFERDRDGNVAPHGSRVQTDLAAGERFAQLAADAPGCIAIERSTLGLPTQWTRPLDDAERLQAATFDRTLDRQWRRTSYSDITAGAYEPWVASEPEDAAVVIDEPPAPIRPLAEGGESKRAGPLATPSLLGEMPVGLRVGTLVHHVLEATDFAAADLGTELHAHIAKAQARRSVDIGDPVMVVAGLRAALETPLGPILDNVRLRDIPRKDRRDELDFELPLAGGDEPRGQFALSALGDVLREHLPDDDPLAGYADRLDDPALRRSVRGYLTGSLDLVLRTHAADGTPRFAVVDYKTNWLAPPDVALTAWHHRPAALAAEMRRAHYGLQALLYTAALHRYLRWRLPGYDPERHLAGVLYLFLRGMTGPVTPTVDGAPCGVFAWRPTPQFVEALSDALDGTPVR